MSKWSEIRNDFHNPEDKVVCIDAWLTDDDNEEGDVIAKINYETREIEYLDEDAKTDSYAQEIIKETLADIDKGDYQNC